MSVYVYAMGSSYKIGAMDLLLYKINHVFLGAAILEGLEHSWKWWARCYRYNIHHDPTFSNSQMKSVV